MSKRNTAMIGHQSVTAVKARARVSRFLFSQVGTQFSPGEAILEAEKNQWRVPILMITPGFIAGQVGEATVSLHTRELLSHTEIEKMHAAAAKLRKKYGAEIEAAFLQARNG
jgi:hypothetical protein